MNISCLEGHYFVSADTEKYISDSFQIENLLDHIL